MVNPSRPNRFQHNRGDNNMRRDRDRRNDRGGKIDRPRRPDGIADDKERLSKEAITETKPEMKVEEPQQESQTEEKDMASETPTGDRKFTGRCRLFVGNLSPETTEKEFKDMFDHFGESSEMFLNAKKAFGFIRMDTRENADKAKKGLDGTIKKGRYLRVRFAAHTAAIRVKHLHPFVSNELLAEAFSMFGEIERAIVCIDEKGKPNGEGIVEFARKPGAMQALKRVGEGVFLLGSSPRPVICELVDHKDEEDGLPEVFMNKNQDFHKERDGPPRFAQQGSFEYNFSMKWKELYARHEQKKQQLQQDFDESVNKLEMDESTALMEHQTQLMREDLRRRQEELRRMEEQHHMEIQRKMDMRRSQEDAKRQMDEERRREDEARMFMQQELAMRQMQADERHRNFQGSGNRGGGPGGGGGGGNMGNAPPMQPPPAPPAGLSGPGGPQNHRGRNDMNMGGGPGGNRGMNQGGLGPMQSGGMGQQGPGNMNPQQMQNMRGRKSDADYRQSRFDQPPQHFQMNPQQQSHGGQQQQQQQHGGQQQQQMPPSLMQGAQMMGMPGNMGNMGNGGPSNNQGRPQHMHDGPRGKHGNSDGSDGGQGDFFEKKRSRRF